MAAIGELSLVAAEQNGTSDRIRAKADSYLVEYRVKGGVAPPLERQHELGRDVVVERRDRDTDQRQSLPFDQRHRSRKERPRSREDRLCVRGRKRQRVRPGRPREIVEAQSQDDRSPNPVRGAQATRDAIDAAAAARAAADRSPRRG